MTTIPLHPELFTTEPRTILRSRDFEARALRYPSGVASLRLTNSRGLIEVLPFMGQIIWDARMEMVRPIPEEAPVIRIVCPAREKAVSVITFFSISAL